MTKNNTDSPKTQTITLTLTREEMHIISEALDTRKFNYEWEIHKLNNPDDPKWPPQYEERQRWMLEEWVAKLKSVRAKLITELQWRNK